MAGFSGWRWAAIGACAVFMGCAGGANLEPDGGVPPPPSEDGGLPPLLPDRGPAAECVVGDTRRCEASPGCDGLQVCLGGMFGPCDVITELCNGLDDDCDGVVDEDYAGVGQACAAGRGACQVVGENVCAENGRGVVCGAVEGAPGTEVCNALDDDCDGATDEETNCPEVEGACNDGVDDDGDGDADCADADCADTEACQGPPEDCATEGDEDGDGRADCDDLDCADDPLCAPPAIEICDQPGDEDGDGQADCDDPDCADFIDCVPPPEEICDVRGDEDGDGQFDCNDPDCAGHPACGPPPDEICDMRGDEDGDGDFDCLDSDCEGHPACEAPTEICDQPGDEDGDALPDCADPDCVGHPACMREEICDSIGDEDGDGQADCDDPDCADDPFCAPDPEICDRAGDEDGDGQADCDDPDCADHPACQPMDPEICDQPGDEDGDGQADCDDPDCEDHPACQPMGPEVCDSIGDEDGDGQADCADPDCADHPFCAPDPEVCDQPGDEDGDGQADCDDPDCAGHPACAPPLGDAVPIAVAGSAIGFEGAIDQGDPQWARPSSLCTEAPGADHYYAAHRVVNQTGVAQRLEITAVWEGDGFLHVFRDPFAPANLDDCIAGNDDFNGVDASLIDEVVIEPGETLVVVASTFAPNAAIGAYTLEVLTLPVIIDLPASGANVAVEGSIDATDPQFDRRAGCNGGAGGADHHYDVYEIVNRTAAAATATVRSDWAGGDGYLFWFEGATPFDPTSYDRCGGNNDDFDGLDASQMSDVPVPANGSVTIIATTFSGGVTIGAYTLTVTTD